MFQKCYFKYSLWEAFSNDCLHNINNNQRKKCTPYAMYTNTWNHGKHHMCARCEFRCVLCNGITHHKLAVKTVHSC